MKYISLLLLFALVLNIGVKAQELNEILGRPTSNSVTVSILFEKQTEFYVEYGSIPGVYSQATAHLTNAPGTPDEIDLENLSADKQYFYRTRYRFTGTSPFIEGNEHSFHTKRAEGSSFSFTIEADVHLYDKKGCKNLYNVCLANQAEDHPDFMIDLGDTFGDDHFPDEMTSAKSDSLHRVYRPILGSICHSVPFYFCLGNHEGEFDYYLAQDPPNNIAVWGTLWRKFYYPNPFPNDFYTGNTQVEPYGIGTPENYYAWTWGDALFVVMDVYRDQCDSSAKPKNWDWTIGYPQYSWLKSTLENSTSKYKFVFAHHTRGQGRGGVITARYFEWGGYNNDGSTWGFGTYRPGWGKPIHQLFVDNGVNIFFQGHDHLFAREELDGVIYQEVPMPSDSTYKIGMLANADAYVSDTLDGSGHLRVFVSGSCVKVDYVRAYLPADTLEGIHKNREVAFSYSLGDCSSFGVKQEKEKPSIEVYPNPAADLIHVGQSAFKENYEYYIFDQLGQKLIQTHSVDIDVSQLPPGIYILDLKGSEEEYFQKFVVQR
ncbi:MAG: T9SS type A sorting domain-containing protein [Bacteroidetes bacterium]|nr:T9SS type A sorting domain-containing protein [Bacteroidota bacterium]